MAEERWRLLSEIANGPRNVRFDDLVKLMKLWGFNVRDMRKGRHGVVFTHGTFMDLRVTAARPHKGKVLFCYVKDCLDVIEKVQIREGTTDA